MRDMTKVVEEIKAAKGNATAVVCDVTKEEQINAAFAHAKAVFGPVSFVFANAGYFKTTPLDKFSTSDVREVLNINLIGPMLTFRAAHPHFLENGGGAIVYTRWLLLPRMQTQIHVYILFVNFFAHSLVV